MKTKCFTPDQWTSLELVYVDLVAEMKKRFNSVALIFGAEGCLWGSDQQSILAHDAFVRNVKWRLTGMVDIIHPGVELWRTMIK